MLIGFQRIQRGTTPEWAVYVPETKNDFSARIGS